MKLDSIDKLFLHELEDLRSAEQQLVEALPKMAKKASSGDLRTAFETHLDQTQEHLQRIDKIMSDLQLKSSEHKCQAMEGLLAEASEILNADAIDSIRDAAMIGAAQRVEHYEIAGYGTARTYAEMLGYTSAAMLLQQTLDEEKETDELLTSLATANVNIEAQNESEMINRS